MEVSPRRVSADFGPLGRVSVRFDERRRDVIKAPKGCEGRITQRYGFFRGGFRFRGGHGWPPRPGPAGAGRGDQRRPVQLRRGVGAIQTPSEWLPDDVRAGFRPGLRGRELRAGRRSQGRGAAFSRRAGLIVVPYASAFGDRDSLAVSRDGGTATVVPPRPFSGSAEYANGRLTGDLAVPLPGLERPVRLTPSPADLDRLREGSSFGCGGGARIPGFLHHLLG